MITGIEVPYLLALLYPGLNYIWWYPKIQPDVEKEIKHEPDEMDGVEMYDYHQAYYPPTYVNVNNIAVPVGGHMSKEKKALLTKHISKDKQKEYFNFWQINDNADINMSFTKKSHINTQSALEKTFKHYNIPLDRFAINLPLEVNYYNYKNGFYLHRLAGLATDRSRLVKEALWRRRMPLTITIPAVAGIGLFCCWTWYAIQPDYYYIPKYYAPFHPHRIKSYFSSKK